MAWVVQIISSDRSLIYESSALHVVRGDIGNARGSTLDKLESPGINDQRFRRRMQQFSELELELQEDVTTTAGMHQRESLYKSFEGQLASLKIDINDSLRTWRDSTIVSVSITDRHGPLHGFGAKSGSLHTILTRWIIQRNTFAVVDV